MVPTVASLIGVVWLFAIVFAIVFGYVMPFAIWRASRDVKQIRVELQRLNTTLESGRLNLAFTVERDDGAGRATAAGARGGAGPLRLT